MQVQLRCSIDELRGLIKRERNPYVRTRLHAVAMAYEQKSAHEIASLLGYCPRVIFKWIKNYNLSGREGLIDKPGRGKPPIFSGEETKDLFCQRMEQGPINGRSVFHGRDIQEILKNEFGKLRKLRSLSDVYYVLHSLGYQWLSPRPRHHRSNRERQEEFKKKFPKK